MLNQVIYSQRLDKKDAINTRFMAFLRSRGDSNTRPTA